jgi:predicted thioesterase
MEYTALMLAQSFLDDGITTVGTAVNITHQNPTPEGAVVRAEAEIIETDGRRFLFKVTAWDQAGIIGEGTHERFTVKRDRLQEKAAARLV